MAEKRDHKRLSSADEYTYEVHTPSRMENKKFFLSIRPTDSKMSLYESLRQKFVKLNSLPIEHYENELYNLCHKHSELISDIDLEVLCNFHAVIELKRKENKLSTESFSVLNQALRREVSSNPDIFMHYAILKESMDLLSGLVIKWGISSLYNILYRFQNIIVTLPMIDLKDIKLNYFSMQTIALTYYIQEPPLSDIVSFECKCYARLAQDACSHILNIILRANDKFGLQAPSVTELIVYKKPRLQSHFRALPKKIPQEYQVLKIAHPLKRAFRINKIDTGVNEIYEALKNFDMAYRKFESSLFDIFIKLNEAKLQS